MPPLQGSFVILPSSINITPLQGLGVASETRSYRRRDCGDCGSWDANWKVCGTNPLKNQQYEARVGFPAPYQGDFKSRESEFPSTR